MMNYPSDDEIKKIREKYPEGTIIKIIKMDDPTSVPPGTLVVVESIDKVGNIHCNHPNSNSSLTLTPCKDQFSVICKNKVLQELSEILTKNMCDYSYCGLMRSGKSATLALKQAIQNEKRRLCNCWDGDFDRSPEASNKRIMDDFNKYPMPNYDDCNKDHEVDAYCLSAGKHEHVFKSEMKERKFGRKND